MSLLPPPIVYVNAGNIVLVDTQDNRATVIPPAWLAGALVKLGWTPPGQMPVGSASQWVQADLLQRYMRHVHDLEGENYVRYLNDPGSDARFTELEVLLMRKLDENQRKRGQKINGSAVSRSDSTMESPPLLG